MLKTKLTETSEAQSTEVTLHSKRWILKVQKRISKMKKINRKVKSQVKPQQKEM